jgi:hypothetical protein
MAWNPFIGKDRKWLESELAAAQRDLSAGKMTIRAADGNVLVQSQVEIRPAERVAQLLSALNKISAEDYPIDQITPMTKARIVFSTAIPATNTTP